MISDDESSCVRNCVTIDIVARSCVGAALGKLFHLLATLAFIMKLTRQVVELGRRRLAKAACIVQLQLQLLFDLLGLLDSVLRCLGMVPFRQT